MVEVGGIEPPSETLPVCRNYDHARIMDAAGGFFNGAVSPRPTLIGIIYGKAT